MKTKYLLPLLTMLALAAPCAQAEIIPQIDYLGRGRIVIVDWTHTPPIPDAFSVTLEPPRPPRGFVPGTWVGGNFSPFLTGFSKVGVLSPEGDFYVGWDVHPETLRVGWNYIRPSFENSTTRGVPGYRIVDLYMNQDAEGTQRYRMILFD